MKLIALIALMLLIVLPGLVAAPVALPTTINSDVREIGPSNIDTSLKVTIYYTDGDSVAQSINTVDDAVLFDWSVSKGKSHLIALPAAKDGTNIEILIDGGYEPLDVTAVEAGTITTAFVLSRLSGLATGGPYNVGESVTTTWSSLGAATWSSDIIVRYYNTSGSNELAKASVATNAVSYSGYTVQDGEQGRTIDVSVYFADSGSANPGDLGTSTPITASYTVASPEFPFGLAVLFGMFVPIYFSMRRHFLDSIV